MWHTNSPGFCPCRCEVQLLRPPRARYRYTDYHHPSTRMVDDGPSNPIPETPAPPYSM